VLPYTMDLRIQENPGRAREIVTHVDISG